MTLLTHNKNPQPCKNSDLSFKNRVLTEIVYWSAEKFRTRFYLFIIQLKLTKANFMDSFTYE